MNIQNDNINKSAVQNERQSKSKQEIINDIIKILSNNNLTITDSKEILHQASKVICQQVVKVSP